MYDWIRPQIAIPAHGEAMHMAQHAEFARSKGVPHVLTARNGDAVVLAPGAPGIVDEVVHGRLHKDGNVLLAPDDPAIEMRRRLAFAGVVSIGLALTARGELAGDPDVVLAGLPARTRDGKAMDALIDEVIFSTFEGLPRGLRRDANKVSTAIERGVRNTVRAAWGKRPTVHVLVMEV